MNAQKYRTARAAIGLSDDDSRHGTWNGYNNLACRCAPCTEANRITQAAYMAENPEQQEKARVRRRERWRTLGK